MHQPGSRFGPYEVVSVIGKGGMGEVYRGIDTRLNRPVAIKISAEQFTDRFNTEARAISALNHPHVCTLYDVGPTYLVMELLEGDTLAARLQKGAMPLADVLRYGAQIAGALAAAHAGNIVHRDLKPANIILTATGAKVLDFGIAKMTGPAVETAEATRGSSGTLAYMAPEQLAGGHVDARSDVYALGLVLFEMVLGSRLVPGSDPGERLAAQPERPAHVIERCLALAPEDRWQSAADVRRELEWAARDPVAKTAAATPVRRYRSIVTAALAMIVVALLGGTAMRWLFQPAAPEAGLTTRTAIALPPGLQLDPSAPLALSPDGTLLAYVALNEDSDRALYLRPLASDTASLIKGTAGATHPFFSPDGRAIGFFADGSLHRVGVDGSAPLRICPLPGIDHGGAWGPDDTIITAIRGQSLFTVKASGGTLEPIAPGLGAAWPSFLPDGTVLYSAQLGPDNRTVGLSVVSLDGSGRREIARLSDVEGSGAPVLGSAAEIQQAVMLPQGYLVYGQDPGYVRALPIDPQTLTPRGTARTLGDPVERGGGSGGIAFAAAGGLLVFAPTGNDHQLVWVTRQGQVTPLPVEPGAYREPSLSPDERTVAISANNETRRPDLWLIDVARATRSLIRRDVLAPKWTPDGRRIAHSGGGAALTLTTPDAAVSERLVTMDEARKWIRTGTAPYPTGWSPDGRYLLFQANNDDVWRLKYPEKTVEPVLTGEARDWDAVVSPNGRFVAFTSTAAGRAQVDLARWPGLEQRTTVSTRGGLFPRWSRDSTELFFWQGRTLMAARVSPTMQVQVPQPLFSGNFNGAARNPAFDVAADGRFLMVKSDERAQLTQITVLQNWMQ